MFILSQVQFQHNLPKISTATISYSLNTTWRLDMFEQDFNNWLAFHMV